MVRIHHTGMAEHRKTSFRTKLVDSCLLWTLTLAVCLLNAFIIWEYSTLWTGDGDFSSIIRRRQSMQPPTSTNRTVVVYTGPTQLDRHIGKNELYLRNFEYFLSHRGVDCDHHDTIVTLSDETYDFYMQNNTLLQTLTKTCGTALRIVRRQDTCYDMGSIHLVLNTFDIHQYDYFVYLNCGVVGPLWWDVSSTATLSWTQFFTSLLTDQVKMAGLSTNCRNRDGFQAHIQSMAFALDKVGLEIIQESGAIYDCGQDNTGMTLNDKFDLIGRYELGMSRAIFSKGYSISSWLWSFGSIHHEPVVIHKPNEFCRDVWNIDPFLKITGGYPLKSPSWNLTFFKTSRFIPPDILNEVGYKLETDAMKDLVVEYHQGLAKRFFAFQLHHSAFVE
jgi:hypothetical protein